MWRGNALAIATCAVDRPEVLWKCGIGASDFHLLQPSIHHWCRWSRERWDLNYGGRSDQPWQTVTHCLERLGGKSKFGPLHQHQRHASWGNIKIFDRSYERAYEAYELQTLSCIVVWTIHFHLAPEWRSWNGMNQGRSRWCDVTSAANTNHIIQY